MDRDSFMRVFGAIDPTDSVEPDEKTATGPGGSDETSGGDKIVESLAGAPSWFFDASGDGTDYRCSGARFGEGFVEARLTIRDDGSGVVYARSVPVPEEHERAMAKLCRMWNQHFRLKGLTVRDGYLTFVSEPLDLVGGRFEAGQAVGLALTTLHTYSSAVLALKAGVDPWELIVYDEWQGGGRGGGEDDDDDGEVFDEIMTRMSGRTSRVRETCA